MVLRDFTDLIIFQALYILTSASLIRVFPTDSFPQPVYRGNLPFSSRYFHLCTLSPQSTKCTLTTPVLFSQTHPHFLTFLLIYSSVRAPPLRKLMLIDTFFFPSSFTPPGFSSGANNRVNSDINKIYLHDFFPTLGSITLPIIHTPLFDKAQSRYVYLIRELRDF